jgi:Na+/proline symporter
MALLGVVAIQWLAQSNADGSGYLAQRTMACRSPRDAELAGVIFATLQVLARSLLWLPIVVGLLVVFPPVDFRSGDLGFVAAREATYVRGMVELLPHGARGLMVTGMLAAFASTLDTHLNWGSSYLTHDLWARFLAPRLLGRAPSPRSLVWTARLGNLLLLAVALALVPLMGSIQTAWQTSLLFGAGIGVVLVLRWVWWRMTPAGELAALGTSLIAAPVLLLAIDDEARRLMCMAVAGTTAGVATALLGSPTPRVHLARFHEQVRPPGFWGAVAPYDTLAARRRLVCRLLAALGGAFSLFALLVGCGSWMLASPAPAWMPWPRGWIPANLAVGLGTLPLWVYLVRMSRLEAGEAVTLGAVRGAS